MSKVLFGYLLESKDKKLKKNMGIDTDSHLVSIVFIVYTRSIRVSIPNKK